jgi:hypothetical protein
MRSESDNADARNRSQSSNTRTSKRVVRPTSPIMRGIGPRNFDEPKKPSRHVKFLDFDPFDTFKDQWFLRSCLRLGSLGSFGWALYLIVNAIGTNIAYDIDRRRNKLTGDPARHS